MPLQSSSSTHQRSVVSWRKLYRINVELALARSNATIARLTCSCARSSRAPVVFRSEASEALLSRMVSTFTIGCSAVSVSYDASSTGAQPLCDPHKLVSYKLDSHHKVVELIIAERQCRQRHNALGWVHIFALVHLEVVVKLPVKRHRFGSQDVSRVQPISYMATTRATLLP